MRIFLTGMFSLLFVAKAFAAEPLAPFLEVELSSKIPESFSTNEPLGEGNWSMDLRIENPNDKAISCRNTRFLAYLDRYGAGCTGGRTLGIYLNVVTDGVPTVELKPFEVLKKNVGFDDRVKRGEGDASKYEFCDRDAANLDCGFTCENGKKYGEEWNLPINTDGYKKYICSKTGTPVELEVKCTTKYGVGETWDARIENGTETSICQPSGNILRTTRCDESPSHSWNGSSCVPSSCGDTEHGKRGVSRILGLGKETATCSYGSWKDASLECNSGAIKENDSCRPANNCGVYSHGATWSVTETQCERGSASKAVYHYQCVDGSPVVVKSESLACTPPPTKCSGRRCPIER